MNYVNPNFYSSYPYNNTQFNNPYLQTPQQYQAPSQPIPQIPSQLNGKIVDSEEMVKVTEVPIGSYGVFPKADLSEIYIKTWNPNGTTSISTFKPLIVPVNKDSTHNDSKEITMILDRISALENKLDTLIGNISQPKTAEVKSNNNVVTKEF